MDKVKDILYAVFVKHLFWSLSVVILGMAVFSWWSSTGSLASDYDNNKSEIDKKNGTIEQVVNKSTDAVYNDETHRGMKEMNDRRRQEVYTAWREKYEKQRDQVLVWPEGLSPEFDELIAEIQKLLNNGPIENVKAVNDDGSDPLTSNLRAEYRDRIQELLPKLAEAIHAEWNPAAVSTGFGGRGGRTGGQFGQRPSQRPKGEGEEEGTRQDYAVIWDSGNQGQIVSDRYDWSDAADKLPTTLEILYSMEDYWVLKAVMQVIARTNTTEEFGLAVHPHQAAIRQIHFIDIGGSGGVVENDVSDIFMPLGEPGATGTNEGALVPPPRAAGGGEGGLEGQEVGTSDDPADGRYVSGPTGNYQAISAATLKSAAESTDNPEQAYLAVAKRMPVRMRVTIDQRKINKFLVECGNSDLMLEVKQVRINPEATDIRTVSEQAGVGSGTGTGVRGGGFSRGGAGRTGRGEGNSEGGKSYPWDVEVEIYGIIYIFNPPSLKRLTDGLSQDEIDDFLAAVGETSPDETTAADADDDLTVPDADAPAAGAATAVPPADPPPADAPPAAEAKATDEADLNPGEAAR